MEGGEVTFVRFRPSYVSQFLAPLNLASFYSVTIRTFVVTNEIAPIAVKSRLRPIAIL